MKKSLIALLALAGVVSAAGITMPTEYMEKIAFNGNTTTTVLSSDAAGLFNYGTDVKAHRNNWMMEFSLSDFNMENGSTHVMLNTAHSPAGVCDSLQLYISKSDDGTMTLGFQEYVNSSGSTNTLGEAITLQEGVVYRASYQWGSGAHNKTYLTNTVTGDYVEATSSIGRGGALGHNDSRNAAAYSDGKVTIALGDAYNMHEHNGESDAQKQEFKAYATAATNKAVPEPTTATLSLLALAGLAARRRRQ